MPAGPFPLRIDMQPAKIRTHTPSERVRTGKIYGLRESFLRFFGDLKYLRNQPRSFLLAHSLTTLPLRGTLLHDPRSYRIKGDDMRGAMNTLKPGDILVRGYDDYVDGYFIPGFFSHAGLYLGRVDEETIRRMWDATFPGCPLLEGDYAPVAEVLDKAVFGEQMVIHSMKDGIFMEDLLNFCRCDYMSAFRFPERVSRAPDVTAPYAKNPAIFGAFSGEERTLYGKLRNGDSVPYADIFPLIFKLALSQLGKEYDFSLDFSSFQKMSCTEFVYYCTKSLEWAHNVRPIDERVMGIRAPGISPDGFAGSIHLENAFSSASVKEEGRIESIRARYPGPYGELS